MEKHIKILGVLYILSGAFSLMGAALFGITFTGAGLLFGDLGMLALFSGVGLLVGGFLAVTGIPGIVGGIGLLKRRPWARTLLLVLGVLHIWGWRGSCWGPTPSGCSSSRRRCASSRGRWRWGELVPRAGKC